MQIEIVPILSDNYAYLVICERTGQAAAVDPAQPEPVVARAEQLGVRLVAVWTTHHHWDHAGGNEELAQRGGVKVFGGAGGRIPALTDPLQHEASFTMGELTVRVLSTPGHTMDALAYCVDDAAFTGDTLFGGGCGRLFEGDAAMMFRSLNGELGRLEGQTRVFCGHEYTAKNLAFAETVDPENAELRGRVARVADQRRAGQPSVPSTMAEERLTNPFLRCDDPGIRVALAKRFPGQRLDDPISVFARLRELRNSW